MKSYIISLLLLFLASSSAAIASGVGWLGDAPIRYFNERDSEMMKSTVQRALTDNEDKVKSQWRNDETGHHGWVQPLNSRTIDDRTCRQARMYNNAGGRTANAVFTFCQQADGQWKLLN